MTNVNIYDETTKDRLCHGKRRLPIRRNWHTAILPSHHRHTLNGYGNLAGVATYRQRSEKKQVTLNPEHDTVTGILFQAHDYTGKLNCRWEVLASLFHEDAGWIMAPYIEWFFGIKQDGAVARGNTPTGFLFIEMQNSEEVRKATGGQSVRFQFLDPCLLAISFMHCKNVILKKQVVPKGLVKKAQKKHDYIPVRYHVAIPLQPNTLPRCAGYTSRRA